MSIVCIVWSSHADALARASALAGVSGVRVFSSKTFEMGSEGGEKRLAEALAAMRTAHAVFVYRSTDPVWEQVDEAVREVRDRVPVVCLSYDPSSWALSSAAPEAVQTCYRYVTYGDEANYAGLLRYMDGLARGDVSNVPPPEPVPWEGLWHPDAPERAFDGHAAFAAWYGKYCADKGLSGPVVGVLLARHYWVNRVMEVETLLVRELEARGLRVLPAFCNSIRDEGLGNKGSLLWSREVFLDGTGAPRVDALIKLQPFFLGSRKGPGSKPGGAGGAADGSVAQEGAEFFAALGVPVFQPVFSSAKTLEEWENDPQGLGSEVAWAVAMPEFEGVIEPFYLGGGKRFSDGATGAEIERRVAHPERVARLASRVRRWLSLRAKPVAERKVAFILHNNPCASVEASVGGAAKLDSLESVALILREMRDAGYAVDVPETGAALIENIMERKAISEFRWTTVQEIAAKGGTLARLGLEKYRTWFDAWPEKVRNRVSEAWGPPPGTEKDGVPAAMVLDGDILITGVQYGNAVICVQPKRGCAGPRCDGRVCKILHDPDIPPPHQYLATYRWLQDEFGADALIHVGTHGNLEFLPGKSVGLSGSCLPDVATHEVPHLYIYNSDNPAEGVIAKRRSYAALVDHMQTVMTQSGLYDELEELDRFLGEWEQARASDPARAHQLEHLIREGIEKAKLQSQMKPELAADFEALAARTHDALSLIRNTMIQDGMHIFGELPEGKRRADFIYSIVRFDAGEEHSLRKCLCRAAGLDLAALLADPGAVDPRLCRAHGELLEEIDRIGAALCGLALTKLPEELPGEARRLLGDLCLRPETLAPLAAVGTRVRGIEARIEASREREALLHATAGRFIPPGPSGIITRGREDILPTGRNFYTLDPRRLPTKAAWRVGQNLARAIVAKHLDEEGRHPENVAMFWMCNDMMWADGEGMAQLYALLGVRPVWLANGHTRGFEIIPLEELGRPRIDVTIRVSGLLRDSFPEAMEQMDEAVQAVAALDEDPEMNFVRKHALERLSGLKTDDADAWRKATYRLFSARPGTYQAGVNLAIYASAWKDEKDLAEIFVHWNGFAYGKGAFGVESPRSLEAALSTVDVTYNKVVTDEHDLFGCCAYYGTHGGMTAAASHLKGEKVRSYYGDTRETEHVEVRDLADEVRRVVRTKLLNPKWIEGMKRHGYKGAGDISKRVGRVYGWEATTQEVDDWIFDDIAKTFVLDKENKEFFEKHNPWALEEIARRLLEAQGRGLWEADPDVLEGLKETYLELEGWLEERTEGYGGEFQGGAVDIVTAEDVASWKEKLAQVREKEA